MSQKIFLFVQIMQYHDFKCFHIFSDFYSLFYFYSYFLYFIIKWFGLLPYNKKVTDSTVTAFSVSFSLHKLFFCSFWFPPTVQKHKGLWSFFTMNSLFLSYTVCDPETDREEVNYTFDIISSFAHSFSLFSLSPPDPRPHYYHTNSDS